MNGLRNILDVLKHNTEKNKEILSLIERLVNLLDKTQWNIGEFNTIGNVTVELQGLLKDYPIEVQTVLKTIIKDDLCRGEIRKDNYIKLFHNVNKMWKRMEEETF